MEARSPGGWSASRVGRCWSASRVGRCFTALPVDAPTGSAHTGPDALRVSLGPSSADFALPPIKVDRTVKAWLPGLIQYRA